MAMYLDIAGITGESKSPNSNWNQKIEIQTAGYDVSQKTSLEAGSGLIASGAVFSALQITKAMDRSTPLLFGKLAGGEPIETVTLRVSRAGAATTGPQGGLFEAETYTLKNVIVTAYHTSGAPGPGGLPLESWSLAFTSAVEKYQTVDPQGNLQPPQSAGYDIAGGAPIQGL
jgi:type VI secretion system Hcp family effector